MRRLIWLPLAGVLLIAGAAIATAAPDAVDSATDAIVTPIHRAGAFLQEILDELVDEGVIDDEQADAIVERAGERAEQKRDEVRALREQMREVRQQLRLFLEDGVITQDELAQLPEDHPLRNLDTYLEDGQLTREELEELAGWSRPDWGPGRFRHFAPGWGAEADE
ncbi:MAG TPA: hypothetical protein VMP67_08780 [Candidatus Limnocylindria bacterium]|nr:hypothetical protein [Candidatus Limnocylindria bacterium]